MTSLASVLILILATVGNIELLGGQEQKVIFELKSSGPGFPRDDAQDVELVDHLAFVVADRAIQVLDVSDVSNPVWVGDRAPNIFNKVQKVLHIYVYGI